MRIGLTVLSICVLTTGCGDSPDVVEPIDSVVRASRRAYDGAPPVIPHKQSTVQCTACHAAQAKPVPGMGIAPANPHFGTDQSQATILCSQCHVYVNAENVIVANEFQELRTNLRHGDRMYPGAPPVMPHSTLMRENCLACHTGLAARPEIRCRHPERTNCRQCHMSREIAASETWPTK